MHKRQVVGCTDLSVRPFTSRPEIKLRGTATQIVEYNFLHETVDTRWMGLCHARNVNWHTAQPLEGDCLDITQSVKHQLANGNFMFLSRSSILSLYLDRTMCPEEHFIHMGYNGAALDLSTIHEPIPELKFIAAKKDPADVPAKKPPRKMRKRTMKVEHATKAKDLTGNGMMVSDLSAIMLGSTLAAENMGLFEHEPVGSDSEVEAGADFAVHSGSTLFSVPCEANELGALPSSVRDVLMQELQGGFGAADMPGGSGGASDSDLSG